MLATLGVLLQNNSLSFDSLSLPTLLKLSLDQMGFTKPTPIQEKAIPVALTGQDLIGCAQTGTGKTAAFCIPMISMLLQNPEKTALVLTPTRELAAQIEDVLEKLLKNNPEIKTALLIGGMSMKPQLKAISRKPKIVVATPGRLMDHLRRRSLALGSVGLLVLDEADQMLDMGFAPQLNEILRYLPKQRQTMLFSATMPDAILRLTSKYLHNPQRVTIGSVSKPVEKIRQYVMQTTVAGKNDMLLDELNVRKGSILIFARTKRRTDKLTKFLHSFGHKVDRIHGDRSQRQRMDAIEGFKAGKCRILVATDIAARGIDVVGIAHVINYDLPQVAEDYVHRIGRTARAGAEGHALSFVTPEDRALWRDIAKFLERRGAVFGK